MRKMLSGVKLIFDDKKPDEIWVDEFPEDGQEDWAEPFRVIQRGIWWWKSFSIARFIPDCGAPASQWGGGWWVDVKSGFRTREEARRVLQAGEFLDLVEVEKDPEEILPGLY